MSETNNYLKSSIEEISNFYKNNTNPPEDMYVNLILELKVSNLMIPVVYAGDRISFPHMEIDENTTLIPLFTSEEEMHKYSDEFMAFNNEIAYFISLVKQFDLDGIIINMMSDEFCIDTELLEKIPTPTEKYTGKGLDGVKLREIALKEKNKSLKRFIGKDSNFNKFDKLSKLLVKSVLLNVVVSEEDLSEYVRNGVIDRNESSAFTMFTKKSGREHYGVIYTDVEAIREFHDTLDYFYYAQVTNKFRVFNFILSHDLDGIIINPGTDEYYVPRQVILQLADEDLMNPEFEDATRYAFPVK